MAVLLHRSEQIDLEDESPTKEERDDLASTEEIRALETQYAEWEVRSPARRKTWPLLFYRIPSAPDLRCDAYLACTNKAHEVDANFIPLSDIPEAHASEITNLLVQLHRAEEMLGRVQMEQAHKMFRN
ncbi:hypothetical protein MMC16_000474 [Acarospora aff. strigata]|nr:hypothetical protein [Acarospora aff. strigata]